MKALISGKKRALHNDKGIDKPREYNSSKHICTQHRNIYIKQLLPDTKGDQQ